MVQNVPAPMAAGIDKLIEDQQALGRRADPMEVARTIAFLLGSDSSFITGSVVTIDGGQIC